MSFSSPEFEIEATFDSPTAGTKTFINVHSFTVAKAPFSKLANLTNLTVEGDYAYLSMISSDSRSQLEPKCSISIYSLYTDEKNSKEPRRGKRAGLLYSGTYFVYSSIDEQTLNDADSKVQSQDQSRIFTFVLANTIIHWLSTNHDGNILIDDSTAADGISTYENYLTSKFKSDAFSFQKLAIDPNTFKYDQILSKSTNDLSIASDLIKNYKAYNSLAYYYHDDFHIGALVGNNSLTSKVTGWQPKAINNITLSLGSILNLPKIDIYDQNHKDSLLHVTVNNVESAIDYYSMFQTPGSTVVATSPDGHVESIIPTTIGDNRPIVEPKMVTPSSLTLSTHNEHRVVHGKSVSIGGEAIIPKNHISVHSPDGINNAVTRYANSKRLITSDIKAYVDMTFQKCYPDLISLTSMYNLDDSARSRFAFLPVVVTNIFHKQQSKDVRLMHSTRAKFMEFNI